MWVGGKGQRVRFRQVGGGGGKGLVLLSLSYSTNNVLTFVWRKCAMVLLVSVVWCLQLTSEVI